MKYDIITFGSATNDIYLISKNFKVVSEKKLYTQKGLCLNLGSKIDVEDILFRTGGGGINTAFTFKNQRFKVAWCGMVGKDDAGQKIIKELKENKIGTSFILKTSKKPTNHSVILTTPGKERTILVFRGAAGELTKKDIPWQGLEANWFYLAPLSGKLALIFEDLVNFAKKNKIKVAVNPGNSQLSLPQELLQKILKQIDVLFLNQEEASMLTKIPYNKENDIFKKLDEMVPGICVMTKGPEGAIASDGNFLYKAPAPEAKVVDVTGAGDSFSAGFLSGLIKKNDISFAMQLGTANSGACISQWGAKEGLLKKNQKWKKAEIKKEPIII